MENKKKEVVEVIEAVKATKARKVVDGITMELIDASENRAEIRVGPFEITFRRGARNKAVKKEVFFLSTHSHEDIPSVCDRFFNPSAEWANAIFRDRLKRAQRKAEGKDRKPLQLMFPFN